MKTIALIIAPRGIFISLKKCLLLRMVSVLFIRANYLAPFKLLKYVFL